MKKPKVLVIVGPTASGKSELAVRIAKKFKGEVISADSRQVYRGLDIGSGKITKKEMRGIPHHLLDVADPKKQFTVAQYKNLATNSLQYIVTNSKLPIVAGGTGFYIDALSGRASYPDVAPNKTLRKKLNEKSAEDLFQMLKKKDPKRAEEIDEHNKVRLIRALEIIESLGFVPKASPRPLAPRTYIYIGLKPDNLDKKIYQRILQRLEGIIREGRELHAQGLSYKRMHELGLEYRYVSMYLQKKLTKDEMVEQLFVATRRYAKRQMTWFKRNKQIRWFNPDDYKKIEKYASRMIGLSPKGD